MTTKLGSRAVSRRIEAGDIQLCPGCDSFVTFKPRQSWDRKIVCNVYRKGKWDHIEHWYEDCYSAAGAIHGEVML